MASYTLAELRVAIEALGFDANTVVVLLVGKTAAGKYAIVQVDDDGKVVTTS